MTSTYSIQAHAAKSAIKALCVGPGCGRVAEFGLIPVVGFGIVGGWGEDPRCYPTVVGIYLVLKRTDVVF